MSAPVCKRIFVAGKVQGVFFRASTAAEANRLGVTGRALNLPDGRVEVLACGTPEQIDALESWLHKGPPMALVTSVEACDAEATEADRLTDFRTG